MKMLIKVLGFLISPALLIGIFYIMLHTFAVNGPHIVDGKAIPYGFWAGYWHGLISPYAFIASLNNANIVVYSDYHTEMYHYGFIIGTLKYAILPFVGTIKSFFNGVNE